MAVDDRKDCLLKLDVPTSFRLEKAVCSHGLFMMSPNQWDPLSLTFSRPLHLSLNHHSSTSVVVRISQPHDNPTSLHVTVSTRNKLSLEDKDVLLRQVTRMLRLSAADENNVKGFERVLASEEGEKLRYMKGFGGRVFRSPTLFEDMVKCMLLCNCQ